MIKIFIIIFLIVSISFRFAQDKNEVTKIDKIKLEKLIKENKEKVIFINVWATWCKPCVQEFPDIVKLYDKYNKEIEFISLSVDFGKNPEEQVQQFLQKQNAKFKSFLIDEKSSEDIINYLNKDWSGAVPATFIYDKSGIQTAFMLGMQNYEDFEKEILMIKDNPK
ncbi:MAG TPA: TlpA disulfide reductase family protein [Ignavibacteriaceae bacterium]|nr:TlpA disulfide reductase family protein [Ignavibacteriaceae bacterium]